jgi:non-canonical purine NTP pyrophosphatase (RdgB/HAM1 family)
MSISFLTGNLSKFNEVKAVLDNLVQLDIDLPEIQELDAHKIIRAKLLAAMEHHQGELIVEDTSLYLDGLNGLPGPLIKWFLQTQGAGGIATMAEKLGNTKATAKSIIGYSKSPTEIHFFEGQITGQIVQPRGNKDFGWGPIFQPEGQQITFGEMERDLKEELSMRGQAARKLKTFLSRQ